MMNSKMMANEKNEHLYVPEENVEDSREGGHLARRVLLRLDTRCAFSNCNMASRTY